MFRLKPEHFEVVVGSTKWSSGGTHYKASKAILHANYKSSSYAFDIALIKLKTPIKFGAKVQPIKYSKKEVKLGTSAFVSGWGLLWVRISITFILCFSS